MRPINLDYHRQEHIRSFAIIAHIDHGKSTLADRLLELTGTVPRRRMVEQILDSNPIERERGITIKLAPVRMVYELKPNRFLTSQPRGRAEISNIKYPWPGRQGRQISNRKIKNRIDSKQQYNNLTIQQFPHEQYVLNLIDTPGHVDFSYEVSRSLAACEGALLLVDATQGIQAQTLANLAKAREARLAIVPVINKIDLPNARIEATRAEIEGLGFRKEEILEISAKTGENVEKILEAIVERIPAPQGAPDKPLRALVFSSQYDAHKGVVVFVRVVDGEVGAVRGSSFARSVKVQTSSPPSTLSVKAVTELEKTRRAAPSQPHLVRLRFLASGAEVTPLEVGYFGPQRIPCDTLRTGEVGYIATGLKDAGLAKVGDTVTISNIKNQISNIPFGKAQGRHIKNQKDDNNITIAPLPGYKEPKPMVFLGLYPVSADDYQASRQAMERLRLSDSAFSFRPISSMALGHGFHCGFLGLLHAEIVQERLLREFSLSMIATAPSVEYRIKLKPGVKLSHFRPAEVDHKNFDPSSDFYTRDASDSFGFMSEDGQNFVGSPQGLVVSIQSAAELPDSSLIEEIREPIMEVRIYSPKRFVGAIMHLAQGARGVLVDQVYHMAGMSSWSEAIGSPRDAIDPSGLQHDAQEQGQVALMYLIPLSEMIVDFFDRLKSATEGYASLDYEFYDYQSAEVVKVDILVNKEKVDALSFLMAAGAAQRRSRELVERLAQVIPRQQFEIPIQAAIGGKVIARADVKGFRKDVTQKLYGGDRTRKDKLLEAQKRGKAKMKRVGKVEIPQAAFFEVLKSQ